MHSRHLTLVFSGQRAGEGEALHELAMRNRSRSRAEGHVYCIRARGLGLRRDSL